MDPVQQSEYHSCWYLGSLRCNDISTNDIDYAEEISFTRGMISQGMISTTHVVSMQSNEMKCKYMLMVSS